MNRHRYEDDVLAWSEEQAALLRAGDVSGLDFQNLAEEIESLGSSQRHEARRRLTLIVHHLLKWRYQPDHRSRSWRATIRVQRRDLEAVLEDSPSVRRVLPDFLPKAYSAARGDALDETGLLNLPAECPFGLEQILDAEWLPD